MKKYSPVALLFALATLIGVIAATEPYNGHFFAIVTTLAAGYAAIGLVVALVGTYFGWSLLRDNEDRVVMMFGWPGVAIPLITTAFDAVAAAGAKRRERVCRHVDEVETAIRELDEELAKEKRGVLS